MITYITCLLLAILLVIPYRRMKIRYRLWTYDSQVDSSFYGTDEMARAYEESLNKLK